MSTKNTSSMKGTPVVSGAGKDGPNTQKDVATTTQLDDNSDNMNVYNYPSYNDDDDDVEDDEDCYNFYDDDDDVHSYGALKEYGVTTTKAGGGGGKPRMQAQQKQQQQQKKQRPFFDKKNSGNKSVASTCSVTTQSKGGLISKEASGSSQHDEQRSPAIADTADMNTNKNTDAAGKLSLLTSAPAKTPAPPLPLPPSASSSSSPSSSFFTPADKVFSRLSWDSDGGFRLSAYDVGYEDRFVGLRFIRADRFRSDAAAVAMPKKAHRYDGKCKLKRGERDGSDNDSDSTSNSSSSPFSSTSSSSSFSDDDDADEYYSTSSDDDGFKCADKFRPVGSKSRKEEEQKAREVAAAASTASACTLAASSAACPRKPARGDYAGKNVKGSDIPFHRVRCFRRVSDGLIVWDREARIDLLDAVAAAFAAGAAERASAREERRGKARRKAADAAAAVDTFVEEGAVAALSGGAARSFLPTSSPSSFSSLSSSPLLVALRAELASQRVDGQKVLSRLEARPLGVYAPTPNASSAVTSASAPKNNFDDNDNDNDQRSGEEEVLDSFVTCTGNSPMLFAPEGPSADAVLAKVLEKGFASSSAFLSSSSSSSSPLSSSTATADVTASVAAKLSPLPFRALTYNVLHPFHKAESIYSAERFGLLVEAIASAGADVITLQEVTQDFVDTLVGEAALPPSTAASSDLHTSSPHPLTAPQSAALLQLRRDYWWTALPCADDLTKTNTANNGTSAKKNKKVPPSSMSSAAVSNGASGSKPRSSSSRYFSSQIIGSRYPILQAGVVPTSASKCHVFAVIADPTWCVAAARTNTCTTNTCTATASAASAKLSVATASASAPALALRVRPVPLVASAVHLVSDFAGPSAAGLRSRQAEELLRSLSLPVGSASAAAAGLLASDLPPFRCVLGADCNFGNQSEEMYHLQHLLASSPAAALPSQQQQQQCGWWAGPAAEEATAAKDGSAPAAVPTGPRLFNDAWLRQYVINTCVARGDATASAGDEGAAAAVAGRRGGGGSGREPACKTIKPFSILTPEDVPLVDGGIGNAHPNSNAPASEGKRKKGGEKDKKKAKSKGEEPQSTALSLKDGTTTTAGLSEEDTEARGGDECAALLFDKRISAVMATASKAAALLSPVGGFTFDVASNPLAATMAERHFYPRRIDRILYSSEHFQLEGEGNGAAVVSGGCDLKLNSVTLIGTKGSIVKGRALFPSDHYGVLATLAVRPFFYRCELRQAELSSDTCSTRAANTTFASSQCQQQQQQQPLSEVDGSSPSPHTSTICSNHNDADAGPDSFISAHLAAWEARVTEPPALAAVRGRIVAKLAQITAQWAAYTAHKLSKEREEGRCIPRWRGAGYRPSGEEEAGEAETERAEGDDPFDRYAFFSEARRRYGARLFVTGSSAMGTHVIGSDIDALLVLPGAGAGFDEWFGHLVQFLNETMKGCCVKENANDDANDDAADENEDEEESPVQWLHAVVPTPQTSKVPIIRLRCTDPTVGDDDECAHSDENNTAADGTKGVVFDVEFGIAVLKGYDKVPPREELAAVAGFGDEEKGKAEEGSDDDASFALLRSCCENDTRSLLSCDGLRSCAALSRFFAPKKRGSCATEADASATCPPSPLATAVRFIKVWAAQRAVHGTSFGYPSGIAWALLLIATWQRQQQHQQQQRQRQSPLADSSTTFTGTRTSTASSLLRSFFRDYGERLVRAASAPASSTSFGALHQSPPQPIYVTARRPAMTAAEESRLGVASWNPQLRPRDGLDLFPVLLPTAPYRNVCDKLTRSACAVLGGEMLRASALLEGCAATLVASTCARGDAPQSARGGVSGGKTAGFNAIVERCLAAVLEPLPLRGTCSGASALDDAAAINTPIAVVHVTSSFASTNASTTAADVLLLPTMCFDGALAPVDQLSEPCTPMFVRWWLRQNLVESSLPTLINGIDKALLSSQHNNNHRHHNHLANKLKDSEPIQTVTTTTVARPLSRRLVVGPSAAISPLSSDKTDGTTEAETSLLTHQTCHHFIVLQNVTVGGALSASDCLLSEACREGLLGACERFVSQFDSFSAASSSPQSQNSAPRFNLTVTVEPSIPQWAGGMLLASEEKEGADEETPSSQKALLPLRQLTVPLPAPQHFSCAAVLPLSPPPLSGDRPAPTSSISQSLPFVQQQGTVSKGESREARKAAKKEEKGRKVEARQAKAMAVAVASASALAGHSSSSAKATKAAAKEVYAYVGPPMRPIDFKMYTRTALVLLPPPAWWAALNAYRGSSISGSVADKSYPRWMPHVTVLFPFVEVRCIQEAIRCIEERFGLARVKGSNVVPPPSPRRRSEEGGGGEEEAEEESAPLPSVTVGLSQFAATTGDGGRPRTRLVEPFAFEASGVGTFDHGKGAAVVFVDPKEISSPTSSAGGSGCVSEGAKADSQSQRLYRELQQLFPRCGRTPLVKPPPPQKNRREVAADEVLSSVESLSFVPHITLARTNTAKDTAKFVGHVEASWPRAIETPTLGVFGGSDSLSTTREEQPCMGTPPIRWDVAEFHLIAHLAGTEGHQIIHTFKL